MFMNVHWYAANNKIRFVIPSKIASETAAGKFFGSEREVLSMAFGISVMSLASKVSNELSMPHRLAVALM